MRVKLLGQSEERMLRAVQYLQNLPSGAYGISVMQQVEEWTGGPVALGAVYTTLARLEAKGFIRSWHSEPIPERGGRAKRMFALEGLGEQALHETERARQRMNVALGGAG
jgi:DNA-binding PadR family transcriptional regulator